MWSGWKGFYFPVRKIQTKFSVREMKEIIRIIYKLAVLPGDVLMPFSGSMSREATRIRGCLRQYIWLSCLDWSGCKWHEWMNECDNLRSENDGRPFQNIMIHIYVYTILANRNSLQLTSVLKKVANTVELSEIFITLTQYDVPDNLTRRPIFKLPLKAIFLALHIDNTFHLYGCTFIRLF